VLVAGRTVAEAYDSLYYLERACQVQLYAMWTHQEIRQVEPAVVAKTVAQFGENHTYGNRPACEHHFEALKRMLERKEAPDYRD
jgi:ribulose-5-phosphate 4-epimerase/fuculose-1-phosphate aldolase